MRNEIYRMDRAGALRLLEHAPVVRIASTGVDGEPILRTVHAVVVDDVVAFHGAPAGEKTEALGRPAVVSAEEMVAPIPSYFIDPERACPATTYYLAAQAHGVLERVDDPARKARILQALMLKLQPEGGHRPIDPEHPLYRAAVKGILVVQVALDRLDGKAKLGQNRQGKELVKILERLWERGLEGDPRAIELVRGANPGVPAPAFLAAPPGARLTCALGSEDAPAAAALACSQYWNAGVAQQVIARAHLGASAWVGAHDASGTLVASARAVSDRAKVAWIYDVVVSPAWRGRGLGAAVLRLLLDHPAVRGVRCVRLATRDAQDLYRRFGFLETREAPLPSWSNDMILWRELAAPGS